MSEFLTVDDAVFDRFSYGTPRSSEYQAGYRAALELRLNGTKMGGWPHRVGTASCDAFMSGYSDALSSRCLRKGHGIGCMEQRHWTEMPGLSPVQPVGG